VAPQAVAATKKIGLKIWCLLAACFKMISFSIFQKIQQPKKNGPLLVQTGR
jgi:hypothetical protein